MGFTNIFTKLIVIIVNVYTINFAMADDIITKNNHCKISDLYPEPNESATWSGKCIDGYAEGKGVVNWYKDNKPNAMFLGKYVHGKMSGFGTFSWANGDKYEGEFKDSYRQGKGVYFWSDGSQYIGEYIKNRREGNGKYIFNKGHENIAYWQERKLGHYVGDKYIVEGFFKDGYLIIPQKP